MSRPTPLSGFPELLPAQRLAEQEVLDSLRRVFELHGFAPLETRAVETLDQLTRKGEIDKEVYVLRRLHAEDGAGDSGLGLHFDLTVPFARYVLENAGHLEFPFRRYQVQKAWRGERPQEGRFREFTQADIDIVGRDTLPFAADVEVAQVMASALAALPIPPVRMQVNNRKLIQGFYEGLGAPDPGSVMRAVDKLDKLAPERVLTLLVDEAGLGHEQARACLDLAEVRTTDSSFADQVLALARRHGAGSELLDAGIAELIAVVDGCAVRTPSNGRVSVEADLRIARGLDYYTGTVFETRMQGFEHLGSICSGGRYDSLASDGRTTYPGVGLSLGVTRTLVPLFARGELTADRSVPSAVLVAVLDENTRALSDGVAAALRQRGIATEVAPTAAKLGKQIRHAERRGIPYVWFPPSEEGAVTAAAHSVKDIRTGDQVDADPQSWGPPAADLRPQLVGSHVRQDSTPDFADIPAKEHLS
jgi:histidyl-tRNA synthetase